MSWSRSTYNEDEVNDLSDQRGDFLSQTHYHLQIILNTVSKTEGHILLTTIIGS